MDADAESVLRRNLAPTGAPIVGLRRLSHDAGRLFEGALVVFVAVAGVSFIAAAVAHVADRAFITYQAGSRMGLALYAREGTLYPPFFHAGFYGGTRMMPVPILLHTGLSFVTGEFLASGKLLTYLSYLALLILAFRAMRSLGCSAIRSTVLLVAVTTSAVGFWTSLTISYDPLPVALQLAALMIVARARGRAAIVTAGSLSALALLSKLSAIWAVGAIGFWLYVRNRRALGSFIGTYVVASGLGFLLFQLMSGGRFWLNIHAFSSSAAGEDGLGRVGPQLAGMAVIAPIFYVLVPLAAIEFVLALRSKGISIYHLALPFAAVDLIVVLTRTGAVFNHFLDLMILSAVATASLWMRWERRPYARVAFVPIALVLATLISYPALRAATQEASPGLLHGDETFLDRLIGPGDQILSEDASIPIQRGQVPVVLDAFMLPTIGVRDPGAIDALVDRLERRGFDRVILVAPVDDLSDDHYTMQFGESVADAIRRNYVLLDARKTNYYVYAPRSP